MGVILGINCAKDKRHLGVENCRVEPGQKKGHIRVPKGWSFQIDGLVDFDDVYVNSQIHLGIFELVVGTFATITEGGENKFQTSSTGEMTLTQRALPLVKTTVQSGYEFHASIYGSSSNGKYDVLEVYETGVISGIISKDGKTLRGHDCGMYDVGTFQNTDGTNSDSTMIQYQLINAMEYNTQQVFLTNTNFSINRDFYNILDVNLVGRADVSENKIYVKASWARNTSLPINVFSSVDFALVDGDPIVGTVPLVNGEYVITPTTVLTLTSRPVVKLKSTTPVVDVAKVGNRFYAGETDVIVPVA